MDVYEAIVDKRDTRAFSPDPVSDEDLHRVLQAGGMAGSAKNQQLNRIVVVTDPPKEGGKAFDIGRMPRT